MDPETGKLKDFSHYYGAWVTPYAPAVQEQIRLAAEFAPDHRLMGYQGNPDLVVEQVGAMYRALREAKITSSIP